jgi:hypothetical protein
MMAGAISFDREPIALANGADRSLSSPSPGNVDQLFKSQLGISSLSDSWRWSGASAEVNRRRLSGLVGLRNAIAHRGGPVDRHVTKRDAVRGLSLIKRIATCSIDTVNMHTESTFGNRFLPLPVDVPMPGFDR